MKITNELLQDSIHCLYKIYKKVNQHSPIESQSEIILLYRKLKEEHRAEFEKRSINQGNVSLGRRGVRKAHLEFNYNLKNEQVDLTFDAIETTVRSNIVPVLTVPFEKIGRTDKLFIAYQVFLACREFVIKVDHFKIVYGEKFRITKLKISSLNKKEKYFDTLKKVLSASNPPVFFRNSHCQVCEFRNSCLERLRERDDLSLLSGLKPQEIAQKNSRGIFTVKQLSYMFRAKKNPYRSRKYSPELKALAIRDRKTYVQEK